MATRLAQQQKQQLQQQIGAAVTPEYVAEELRSLQGEGACPMPTQGVMELTGCLSVTRRRACSLSRRLSRLHAPGEHAEGDRGAEDGALLLMHPAARRLLARLRSLTRSPLPV